MDLELLCEIELELAPPPIVIPDTPDGTRVVVHVSGGRFEGPRFNGKVIASGADWFLMRPDGVGVIDVRLVLRTHDRENIYMTYNGRAQLDAGGPTALQIAPTFAASTNGKYAWLNGICAVATGERQASGPIYHVFQVM